MNRRHSFPGALLLSLAGSLAGCVAPTPHAVTEAAPRPTLLADAPAVAALPPAARATLGDSRIPMLVFPVEYAARTEVFAEDHWTEVLTTDEAAGLSFSLYSTNVWQDAPDEPIEVPAPSATVRGEAALFMVPEPGTAALTWTHADVPYLLSIACDEEDDPRCDSAEFLVSLGDSLVPSHAEGSR